MMIGDLRFIPGRLPRSEQEGLRDEILALLPRAPLFVSRMPKTGKPMSVRMTNFGPLGWVSDQDGGYRYQATHPETGQAWPSMPTSVLQLWDELAGYAAPPEACLVNCYDATARMGQHRDFDELALDAPVLSLSLGDDALFRVGGPSRRDPTRSFRVRSGDIVVLAGASRLCFHGVDRIYPGTSSLIAGGGRINVTLRRVTRP